jgi:hypothetical protein
MTALASHYLVLVLGIVVGFILCAILSASRDLP